MKPSIQTASVFIATALFTPIAWGQPTYSVTDLGVLPGYQRTLAGTSGQHVLTDNGVVVATCRQSNPGSCSAGIPPSEFAVTVRYVPGVGLRQVPPIAANEQVPIGVNENGSVFGYGSQFQLGWTPDCVPVNLGRTTSFWRFDGSSIQSVPAPESVISAPGVLLLPNGRQFNNAGTVMLSTFDGLGDGGRAIPSSFQGLRSLAPSLPSGQLFLVAMNEAGQLAGSIFPSGDIQGGRGFLFTDGQPIEVFSVPGGRVGQLQVESLSNAGDIIGRFMDNATGNEHAFVKPFGQPAIDIHDPTLGLSSKALQSSGGRYVAGASGDSDGGSWFVTNLFRWDAQHGAVALPISSIPGVQAGWTILSGVNERGEVIGSVKTDIDFRVPFVWSDSRGLVFLRDAIGDPFETQWRILDVIDINNRGQIVVQAFVATDNDASTNARVLLLSPINACVPDFDQNGMLSVQDIFAFLNAWFGGDVRADLDGNGLSVQDIFAFLNAWFTGC